MTKEEKLEQSYIEHYTKADLENWSSHNPMCVSDNVPEDMEDGPMYKCWIYYSDGWGCSYAHILKYEKV